ncbi:hypothetical protein D3C86_1581640 [compost metagenome]
MGLVLGQVHPYHLRARASRHVQPRRVGQLVGAHLARERPHHQHADAEHQVLARGVQQALVFGVAQVVQVGRAVAVVRVAGDGSHRRRAVAPIERVLVEQAERLAGGLHQRADQLVGQRGLAGAGVAAEEDQSWHGGKGRVGHSRVANGKDTPHRSDHDAWPCGKSDRRGRKSVSLPRYRPCSLPTTCPPPHSIRTIPIKDCRPRACPKRYASGSP